jgi:hypothetical protein
MFIKNLNSKNIKLISPAELFNLLISKDYLILLYTQLLMKLKCINYIKEKNSNLFYLSFIKIKYKF